jgi:aromatic-L-amino-acid decarboxylase
VDALDVTPSFLRSKEADDGTVIDYRNWQLALGRRFRSIKIWFVMRSYGVEGFQTHLRKGIDQAHTLAQIIKDDQDFELVAESLALVVFRLNGDEYTQRLHDLLSLRSDVFLTQTMLHSNQGDRYCIRLATGGINTSMADVEAVWNVVTEIGRSIL